MAFHINQKVECIRDYSAYSRMVAEAVGVTCPTKGAIYTIRRFVLMPPHADCIILNEIRNPDVRWVDGTRDEAGFFAHDFRPITDISSLVQLTKVRELEDA